MSLQGISRARKLEHRNTDSNRSTRGNKDYKIKIGRKGENARLENSAEGLSEDRVGTRINSST